MDFSKAKVPSAITPCPIHEAVVELRFDSSMPGEIIPGLLFNAFQGQLGKIQRLPLLDLPAVIRDNDPNMKYAPHYKAEFNKDFVIQFGPRCFSLLYPKEYKGWSLYYPQICTVFEKIEKLNIITKPVRIGLRYVSFLDQSILEQTTIDFSIAGNDLKTSKTNVRSEFDFEGFLCVTQICNHALLNGKLGTTIDIDIIKQNDSAILKDFKSYVEKAHAVEKKLFFNILKEEYVTNNLSPKYT